MDNSGARVGEVSVVETMLRGKEEYIWVAAWNGGEVYGM
jgi:ligand-binding sensor domain-containing protein